MTNNTIAKRYAKALVQIGSESAMIDTFRSELNSIYGIIRADGELQGFFSNPAFTAEQKKNIMKELVTRAGCCETVANFLLLLVDKNRQSLLGQIVLCYETLADDASGLIRPRVSTAFPLDDGQIGAIRTALENSTGRKAIPQVAVDPSLVGGVVVQIGDMVYDNSVRTQLKRIQDILEKG